MERRFSGAQRGRSSQSHRLCSPCVALTPHLGKFDLQCLDASVKFAGIDGGLDEHVLRGGKLLAQFGVLRGKSEEQAVIVFAHRLIASRLLTADLIQIYGQASIARRTHCPST